MPERFSNAKGTADMYVGSSVICDRVSFDTRTEHEGDKPKWTAVDLPVSEVRLLAGHLRRLLDEYDATTPHVTARRVVYATRDLGYGIDRGAVYGRWGGYDAWGKRAFYPLREGQPPLFLFDDEIVTDVEITL